jgi:salicylate hydroxylase
VSTLPLRVLIAGGGIGGLCLAQGLRQAGIDITVFERARSRTDFVEGYRLHISPQGSRALHACLPAELFATFHETSGRPPRAMSFLTEGLAELLSVDVLPEGAGPDPVAAHRSVNRYTLRQILLIGLDDVIRFGKECTGYDWNGDGVTARFADGTTADGTILVGAEGGSSPVRAQLLPHAERVETGVVSVGGRLPLTSQTRSLLPRQLGRGPAAVLAPHGSGMFIATHETVIDDKLRHLSPPDADDYVIWAISGLQDRFPLAGRTGEALRRVVIDRIHGWHPHLRELVERTSPSAMSPVRIRTAVPVPPWQPGNVTVLGDAIHSMPPSLGVGANIALRDAEALTRRLTAVHQGELSTVQAIGQYEQEMRQYGFAAVRASNRVLKRSTVTNPLAFAAAKAALRIINTLPPVKNLMFR